MYMYEKKNVITYGFRFKILDGIYLFIFSLQFNHLQRFHFGRG